ncbi:MAG TPA: 2,3-epoxybenzoyl-CoA dihydrolase [Polyangia bacterium]
MEPIRFETHPSQYKHWKLELPTDGSGVATLAMGVDEHAPLRPGYELKLNSYDLGVDIELADAIQRLRFEHPDVRALVITSGKDRIFCAGANIHMLASSTHPFKVNFCKFTNETRLALEDASANSGLRSLAACNGPTAGGGYELALACDEIVLLDDGSSTVSLPEVPLLGVLPGTGGLTRVVDKRGVRRDLADVFATLAEGIKGKRAVEWKLVDAVAPRSKFADAVKERAKRLASLSTADKEAKGVELKPLEVEASANGARYKYVELAIDRARRTATITVRGPDSYVTGLDPVLKAGCDWWYVRAFRELDDALLRLRFNHEDIGLLLVKTRGDRELMMINDGEVEGRREHWFVRETILNMARVLRRLDLTARSMFAILDPESCFVGSLLELALAADRRYMLDDPKRPVHVQASGLNGKLLPTANELSRLEMLGIEEELPGLQKQPLDAQQADEAGLVTVLADDLDFDDTLRLAIEERASLSPDALTGMEASFRCVGNETMQTKIFGRLSAWQNWIFTRPNATGERGALSLYGKPERPSFDWRRT